jgi:hypothetical protein
MVPVAAYINAPDYEHDGSRVYAILKESGIQAIGAASAGVTVSVPRAMAFLATRSLWTIPCCYVSWGTPFGIFFVFYVLVRRRECFQRDARPFTPAA